MAELVPIEDRESTALATGAGSPRVAARRSASKTALVLGGGGFTGGVYEIGALRALDLLSVNHNVNQFDIYVGTSAGSMVAAMAANGITPEQMMQEVDNGSALPFRDGQLGKMLRPNYREFVTKGVKLPIHLAGLLRTVGRVPASFSPVDLVVALAEGLPSGLYTGSGIQDYLHGMFSAPGRSDDFRALDSELYVAATDLDTCERVVLGAHGWDDVPISAAVRASTAIPMLYKPFEIRQRILIDGGIFSTTNLDLAVEAGAKLVIVINPLVPFINASGQEIDTLVGTRVKRVADMGFPKIGYQTFKLIAHQRLHEMARDWESRYPDVDFVLIEPDTDDELMFETNIMDYASRLDVARHGFRSVTMKLADDYERLDEISRRHGIEISPTRLRRVVGHFMAEPEKARAWRRILEQTTGSLLRQSAARR
jgi:NTE family protein